MERGSVRNWRGVFLRPFAIGKKDALNRHTHTGGIMSRHSVGIICEFPIPDRMLIDADKAKLKTHSYADVI